VNFWLAQNGLPPNTGAPMCTDGELTAGVTGNNAVGADGVEIQCILQDATHGCEPSFPATINLFF
jgi:hypothetical protein